MMIAASTTGTSMTRTTSTAVSELTNLATLAPLVMAARMRGFWMTAASPTARLQREASLMVTEKIQAVAESLAAMSLAMVGIGIESALAFDRNGLRMNFMDDMDRIAAAGLRPYSKKVRANRKRLAG